MISKMIRYDILLHAKEQERFVNELRELGLVDITTTGWEPTEADRALLLEIEAYNRAIEALTAFAKGEEFKADAEPYFDGAAAYDRYVELQARRAEILQKIAQLEKSASDVGTADIALVHDEGCRYADSGGPLGVYNRLRCGEERQDGNLYSKHSRMVEDCQHLLEKQPTLFPS